MAKSIAYLMSRFPKISETFILYEILELQRRGLHVEVFPLLREHESVMHPAAEGLVRKAYYVRLFSRAVILAQFYWLLRRPLPYIKAWIGAITGNLRSPSFLMRALFVIPVAAQFAAEVQRLQLEHVHAHWATHPALAAWAIWKLTGIPYSFTAHAHDIYVQRPMLKQKLQEAAFVVTISDYNKRMLERLYGNEIAQKIHVIHCGIDPNVFHPRSNNKSASRFTILCVASLSDYKGHRYLLDACTILRKNEANFCCVLVGEGGARNEIESQIRKLGLQQNVHLLGWQTRERVNEMMSKADVMVLPSICTKRGRKEGIPVALMEALAMELPVVSTSISGIPELVQHGRSGMLVPEKDSAALAEALLDLYRKPELGRRLAEAGRSKVLEDFNLYENVAKLHSLFERAEPIQLKSAASSVAAFQTQEVPRW